MRVNVFSLKLDKLCLLYLMHNMYIYKLIYECKVAKFHKLLLTMCSFVSISDNSDCNKGRSYCTVGPFFDWAKTCGLLHIDEFRECRWVSSITNHGEHVYTCLSPPEALLSQGASHRSTAAQKHSKPSRILAEISLSGAFYTLTVLTSDSDRK